MCPHRRDVSPTRSQAPRSDQAFEWTLRAHLSSAPSRVPRGLASIRVFSLKRSRAIGQKARASSTSPSRRVSPLSGRVGRCGRVAARLFLHGNRARSGEPSTSGRQLSDDKRRVTAGGVTVTLAGEKGARGDSRALLFTRSFVTEPYLHTPPERERTPLRLTATR